MRIPLLLIFCVQWCMPQASKGTQIPRPADTSEAHGFTDTSGPISVHMGILFDDIAMDEGYWQNVPFLTFRIRNRSSDTIEIWNQLAPWMCQANTSVSVTRDGAFLPANSGFQGTALEFQNVIRPGECAEGRVHLAAFLKQGMEALTPGRYSVEVRWRPVIYGPKDVRVPCECVVFPTVEFEIVAVPAGYGAFVKRDRCEDVSTWERELLEKSLVALGNRCEEFAHGGAWPVDLAFVAGEGTFLEDLLKWPFGRKADAYSFVVASGSFFTEHQAVAAGPAQSRPETSADRRIVAYLKPELLGQTCTLVLYDDRSTEWIPADVLRARLDVQSGRSGSRGGA